MRFTCRRLLAIFLTFALTFSFVPNVSAALTPYATAADKLHTLGLLAGTGTNPDGTISYGLDLQINRVQAITLIVNLMGKYDEAISKTWTTPFTDVPSWALPFVGYAYTNKITTGISETKFGSIDSVTPKQYITFVLNALEYVPGIDFEYDKAWDKSDELAFTNGRYNNRTTKFLRGDAISITYACLFTPVKSNLKPLYKKLISAGAFSSQQANLVGFDVGPDPASSSIASEAYSRAINISLGNSDSAYFDALAVFDYFIAEYQEDEYAIIEFSIQKANFYFVKQNFSQAADLLLTLKTRKDLVSSQISRIYMNLANCYRRLGKDKEAQDLDDEFNRLFG